jgi:hypothetical protein
MPTTTPAETGSLVGKTFTLRCFVYPQKATGLYVAECIDLDIMVKAKKANRARKELDDAIHGYVKVACEAGQADVLIPRLSPLSHRLHYHLMCLGFTLTRRHAQEDARIFQCTAPAYRHCAT